MTLRRILFVDDEVSVLEGLQNTLRKQRRIWDMVFAPGGQAALTEMAKAPFDVIVSDMRMPGMDGPALLQEVRNRYPGVARIVLSGQADREAVLRAIPVAHQFLTKPCDAEVLRAVIERTGNLQTILQDETSRRLVGRLDKLPSVAASYWALTKALMQPEIGLAEIADIMEEDPAMSAKVLQLVNSAYFGFAHRVTSIHQAVMYLGVELLRGLLLTARAFALMGTESVEGFSLDQLQAHSVLTGRAAARFLTNPQMVEEAFTAGILHDVGQIVLALGFPDRFGGVRQAAREGRRPLQEIEKEILGVTHAEVGAYLLGVWGLPFSIVEAVAFHHCPSLVTEGARDVLAAVHVADALVEARDEGLDPGAPNGLDIAFLEAGGWAAGLPRWRDRVALELPAAIAAGQPGLHAVSGRERS
jgi:HD-like signal output (HDOD) protein